MKLTTFSLFFVCWACSASAQAVLAARTVRAHTIITPEDLTISDRSVPGAFVDIGAVAGKESRVILYAGRPILAGDVATPALVDRNQIVALIFSRGGLRISTEARSMNRGAVGDTVRVMNLASRNIVNGIVRSDGSVEVGGSFQ